jgi:hypothetical protein
VKILGKVENLVCRILPSFSTGNENAFDVHDERGKYTSLLSTHLETDTTVVVSSVDDSNKHYSKEDMLK